MDLNLITRAKKNINKIPLIGYILAGKDKRPSITVKVSGDLSNPDIKKSVFKEVVTQPFSMAYRTLALPGYLVSHMFALKDDGQEVEGKSNGGQAPENMHQEEYMHKYFLPAFCLPSSASHHPDSILDKYQVSR